MNKRRILILAEGFEEEAYLKRILNFQQIKKDLYDFNIKNTKGNQRIIARYQNEYQTNQYELILVFCDADKGAQSLIDLINKLGDQLFGNPKKAEEVFIYANPVTMQIVLSHFAKVNLKSSGKKVNAPLIERLTGIKDYDARQNQIEEMMNKIFSRNYEDMKENLKDISQNYNDVPSTNFLKFIEYFESDDTSWIDKINDILNS